MLFNVETAEDFSVWASFLYKDIIADSLVERAYFDSLFRFGIPEFVNLDAENRFEEGPGDFLVAEHHCEHESVRNGELFKRSAFCSHFSFYSRNASVFANREPPLSILYTYFSDTQRSFFEKFISFYKAKEKKILHHLFEKILIFRA